MDLAKGQDRVSAASAALEVRLVPQKRISERTQIVDVPVLHSAQPSINQVTKCAEFPQTQYIDKFVEMLVVMQRKVPQIQTVLKTVEIPPAKFVDRVVDAPRP